jgi:hypothetical protein
MCAFGIYELRPHASEILSLHDSIAEEFSAAANRPFLLIACRRTDVLLLRTRVCIKSNDLITNTSRCFTEDKRRVPAMIPGLL